MSAIDRAALISTLEAFAAAPTPGRDEIVPALELHQIARSVLEDLTARPADEWEYRFAEVHDGGEMYIYGAGPNGDMSYPTYEAAHAARIEETDVVVRRRRAGGWEEVS